MLRIRFSSYMFSIAVMLSAQNAALGQLAGPSTEALANVNNRSVGVFVQSIGVGDFSKLNVWTSLKPAEFSTSHHAVIGRHVADELGLTVGDNFTIVHPTGKLTPLGRTPTVMSFDVTAIIGFAPSAEATITVYISPQRFEELSDAGATSPGK